MKKPPHLASRMYGLARFTEQPAALKKRLLALAGVEDVVISKTDQTVYLRVDSQKFDATCVFKSQ